MPYTSQPSDHSPPKELVSDGTYARFATVAGERHMSRPHGRAAKAQVGTATTYDGETQAAKRHNRSGTPVSMRALRDGEPRTPGRIAEFRTGQADDERDTFELPPDGARSVRESMDHLQIAEPVHRRTRLYCSTRPNRPQWRRRLRVAWTYNRPPSSCPFRHAHP